MITLFTIAIPLTQINFSQGLATPRKEFMIVLFSKAKVVARKIVQAPVAR